MVTNLFIKLTRHGSPFISLLDNTKLIFLYLVSRTSESGAEVKVLHIDIYN